MVAGWNKTTLPTLLSNYGLENIYNFNEFGVFSQCTPDKSYQLKTDKCSGGKHIKIRITVWQLSMRLAIKFPCLLLVKEKKQCVLNTLRKLPVDIIYKERPGWIAFYLKNR